MSQNKTAVLQRGQPIDLRKLYTIESSNIADAHNKATDARGLGQITPIALKEYNTFNPQQAYKPDDLFQVEPNDNVSNWYINQRIPQMLGALGIADTVDNRLIAYNAGVGVLAKVVAGKRGLKPETVDYLRKYKAVK